jgi:ATP-dependent Clp endopeptidase proteolytic subunit ClpP
MFRRPGKATWGKPRRGVQFRANAAMTNFSADKDEDDDKPSVCEVVENRIYYYADIECENVLELNKNLRETTNELMYNAQMLEHTPAPLYLHINSQGGDVFAGLSAMDNILNNKLPVTTIVDGCAASAATFLSIVGKRRLISKHSYILIHQISSAFWGKYTEFEDEKANLDALMKMLRELYKEYTKIPKQTLDDLLKRDLWLDANTAKKYGLVDEIL